MLLLKTSVERRSSTIRWRKERKCARVEVNKCQASEVKTGQSVEMWTLTDRVEEQQLGVG